MKNIITLGACGWSYITDNDEAADAIERVVYAKGFDRYDYNLLSEEAKEIFDDFADGKTIWVTPDDNLVWENELKEQWRMGGSEFTDEDAIAAGYEKFN